MKKEKGQALIIFLIAGALAILILSTATINAIGLLKTSFEETSAHALREASLSGVEYGLQQLIRSADCMGSDNLAINNITVTVTYTAQNLNCQVTASALATDSIITISAIGFYDQQGVFNVCCWQEDP